jgi:hypothetical protein
MKNLYRFSLFTVCVLMATALTAGVALADIFTYTATLTGANEVPPVATPALGIATLVIDQEAPPGGVPLHVEFNGLSSTQTGAHFHTGAAGVNGPVVYTAPLGSPVDTEVFFSLTMTLNLAAGTLYFNVHSEDHPGGEIRGPFVLSNTVANENATWGAIKSLYR